MTTKGSKSSSSSRKRSHDSTTVSSSASSSHNTTTSSSKQHSQHQQKQQLLSFQKKHSKKLSTQQQSLSKRVARALSISSSTMQSVMLLCVAIVAGLMMNAWEDAKNNVDDPQIHRFLNRLCQPRTSSSSNNDNVNVYCHPSLVPTRRSQRAIRTIHPHERILEIPRSLQLWDLDAVRDPFIRNTLGGAKHAATQNPVDSAAYLAVYLGLLAKTTNNNSNKTNQDNNNHSTEDASSAATTVTALPDDSPLVQYLTECLPNYDDLKQFHPILWNDTELKELLPPHSASFSVAKAYRDMVKSEYQAFMQIFAQRHQRKRRTNHNNNHHNMEEEQQQLSSSFEDYLSEQDYQTFRILVLSRSFGTGPVPIVPEASQSSSLDTSSSITQEEMQYYANDLGIDMSKGSYAMVPILDFYDHHARPNVEYSYSRDKRVFVIQATGSGIVAGQEVVDSYGKYTDAHLFAKFGFVNGDGSGYSQANLATHHHLLDFDLKQQYSYLPFTTKQQQQGQGLSESLQKALARQREGVMQYLRFDDGYEECISLEDEEQQQQQDRQHPKEAYELKKLKLQHLVRIANHSKRWHLILLPRAPESLPARASNIPITVHPPKITKRNVKFFHRKEYQLVAATCRLISLTHHDYNGSATELLRANLHNNSFLLSPPLDEFPRDSPAAALEFRTHFCLARLASVALQRFADDRNNNNDGGGTSIADMEDRVAKLNRNSFQSNEWTAAHLQLSEMQALEVLRGVSFSAAREYEDLRNRLPAFFIRDNPCPVS